MPRDLKIAVLGATGAVGNEFLRIFEQRKTPLREVVLLASERSAGTKLPFMGSELAVQAAQPAAFEGVDVAYFSAGASRSREFAPAAQAAGALVVDNSSAFRMHPDVPLIVPEVNLDAAKDATLIANPNCVAIILLMALAPLARLAEPSRVVVSTYQSASGAGAAAMRELEDQTRAHLSGEPIEPKVMPHPYAFNLFSHNTPIGPDGFNEEETKVVQETRKVLNKPDLPIAVTCIRVPVLRAHSMSVVVEFRDQAPTEEEARAALAQFPGVKVVDRRADNHFPMPNEVTGIDEVHVGRIRRDPSHPQSLMLFVAGDQLRKGAALNAVQIGEALRG